MDIYQRTFTIQSGELCGACCFCRKFQVGPIDEWKKHFALHCSSDKLQINSSMFGCKLCDSFATTKHGMVQHILQKHTHGVDANIDNCFKTIQLLPGLDYFAETATTKYKFIDKIIRYKCDDCKQTFCDEKHLEAHLKRLHIDKPYTCSHCGELIAGEFPQIEQHLSLHAENLYECNVCGVIHTSNQDIIIHIWNEHTTEDFKFRHIKRTAYGVSFIEDIFNLLQCNACENRFRTIQSALIHFVEMHSPQNMEFTGTYWITRTDSTLKVSSMTVDRWLLRQLYICDECNETSITKDCSIQHQITVHSKETEPKVKLSHICWSEIPEIRTTFQCSQCPPQIRFESVHDVHTHWKAFHHQTLFGFYVCELAACGYCHFIGTYDALQMHYTEQHIDKIHIMVNLVNRKMCALCDYIGNEMFEHFKNEHDWMLSMTIISPIRLTSESLQAALVNDINGKECVQCHYKGENGISHLICGCCQERFNESDFFEHFLEQTRPFICLTCQFQTTNLYAIANHDVTIHGTNVEVVPWIKRWIQNWYWQTKVIFSNGAVLSKYNLLRTKYDDSKLFAAIVTALMDEHARNFSTNVS